MRYTACVAKGRCSFRASNLSFFGAYYCAFIWWAKGFSVYVEKDGEE